MVDDKETRIGDGIISLDNNLGGVRENGLRVYPVEASADIILPKAERLHIPISKTIDVICLNDRESLDLKILVPDKSHIKETGIDSLFLIGKTAEEEEFNFYSIFDMDNLGTVNPIHTNVDMDYKVNFNHYDVASIEIDSTDLSAITISMNLEALLSLPYLEVANLRKVKGINAETGELLIKRAYGPEHLGILAYHPRLKIAVGDVIKLGDEDDTFGEFALSFFFSEVYNALPYYNKTTELIGGNINSDIQRNTLSYLAYMNGKDQELINLSKAIIKSKDYFKASAFRELSFVTFGLVTGDGDSNFSIFAKYALDFLENEYDISPNKIKHFDGVHSEQLNDFNEIMARLNPQTGTLFMYGFTHNKQQVQFGNYHVLK